MKRHNSNKLSYPIMRSLSLDRVGAICVAVMLISGCDGAARESFYEFCEQNRGFLPEQKIDIDGAEFRGGFAYRTLPGLGAWFRYAEYYEFSSDSLTGKVGDYNDERNYIYYDNAKRNEDLGLDETSIYEVREYERASPECELFYRFKYVDSDAPGQVDLTNNDRFSSYLSQEHCIGIQKADQSLSDYVVEASYEPTAGRVLSRPISEYKITVTQRSSKDTVAVLREFKMEPRMFLFLKIGNDKTGLYDCNSSSEVGEELGWDLIPVDTALSHVFQ